MYILVIIAEVEFWTCMSQFLPQLFGLTHISMGVILGGIPIIVYAIFYENWWFQTKRFTGLWELIQLLWTIPIREFFHFHHLPKLYFGFKHEVVFQVSKTLQLHDILKPKYSFGKWWKWKISLMGIVHKSCMSSQSPVNLFVWNHQFS